MSSASTGTSFGGLRPRIIVAAARAVAAFVRGPACCRPAASGRLRSQARVPLPGPAFNILFFPSTNAPDVTGSAAAHQPRGRDSYATNYRHYQVIAAKWKIDFASSGSIPTYVGWCIRRLSTTSTVNDYIESGDCAYRILGDEHGGNNTQTVFGNVNVANHLGMDFTDNALEADYDGNPADVLFLHVFTAALDPTGDPISMRCGVTIDYDTKWRERALQGQS